MVEITREEPKLYITRPMYEKTRGLGALRKDTDPEIQRMIWAQQYRPMRINGTTTHQAYCAYGGIDVPLKISPNTGFAKPKGGMDMHIDHRIPNSANGEDHPLNFQGLGAQFNLSPMKGDRKTFHVRWEAFRRGGTIDGLAFEPLADQFFWCFDNYQKKNAATDIELAYWWPWWNRDPKPPFRPILWGYDEKTKKMTMSPEESLKAEWARLARHVLLYLRFCDDITCTNLVRQTFEREYLCSPETMASFRP